VAYFELLSYLGILDVGGDVPVTPEQEIPTGGCGIARRGTGVRRCPTGTFLYRAPMAVLSVHAPDEASQDWTIGHQGVAGSERTHAAGGPGENQVARQQLPDFAQFDQQARD